MNSILILVTLSALSGIVAGRYFSWPALVVAGGVLAPLSAVVLQHQDFTAVPGISIIVACLAINQLAYAIAIRVKNDSGRNAEGRHLPQQGPDPVPSDDRNDDIHYQHQRHQKAHFNLAQFAVPGRADLAP
jgi:hypothetical protein